MKTSIVLGGPNELWPKDIKNILSASDKIVGVDRGNIFLKEIEIVPDIAIGDFDSITESEKRNLINSVKDIRFANPVKDLTDSELSLLVALNDLDSDEVVIIGATGGRIDHLLVNLLMVLNNRFRSNARKIKIIDQQNLILFFNPGQFKIKRLDYKYLAFVPLTSVKDFNIVDAKYRLDNFNGEYPISFASNEFVGNSVEFNFKSGVIAVIYSNDGNKKRG